MSDISVTNFDSVVQYLDEKVRLPFRGPLIANLNAHARQGGPLAGAAAVAARAWALLDDKTEKSVLPDAGRPVMAAGEHAGAIVRRGAEGRNRWRRRGKKRRKRRHG